MKISLTKLFAQDGKLSLIHIYSVLSKACGEGDHIYAAHSCDVGTDVFDNAVSVCFQTVDGILIACLCCCRYITVIAGDAGHAEHTGFLVQNIQNLGYGQVLFVAQILNKSRIDISGTGSHEMCIRDR